MLGFLRPSPTLSEQDAQRALRLMRWDGVAGGAMFSLGSGGFMAAYALALGANNLQVGILAALPPMAQIMQIPAILVIERFRARKAIGLPAWFLAQLMWLPIGAVPFLLDTPGAPAVAAVIALLALRGVFTPVWVTASVNWMRDLVPQELLGSYYSRRLALMTVTVAIVGLGGSFFVRWWQDWAAPGDAIFAYSFLLIGGWAVFGLVGPLLVTRAKEPLMPPAANTGRSAVSILLEPLKDGNFMRLPRFLIIWNFALNMAVPFFAVYMLTRLGLSLPVVIGFTILSQVTNVLFVRVWGAMADRTGSKTVLSLSASLYLLVIIGWVFTTHPDRYFLTLPLLGVLHFFAGVASAGRPADDSDLNLEVGSRRQGHCLSRHRGDGGRLRGGLGPGGGRRAGGFLLRAGIPVRSELVVSQRGTRPPGSHAERVRFPVRHRLHPGAVFPEPVDCAARGRRDREGVGDAGAYGWRGPHDAPGQQRAGGGRSVCGLLRLSPARSGGRRGPGCGGLPTGLVYAGGGRLRQPGGVTWLKRCKSWWAACWTKPRQKWRTWGSMAWSWPATLLGAQYTPERSWKERLNG